jgi:hypothetical protein
MKRCLFLISISLMLVVTLMLVGEPTASASDADDDNIQVQGSSDEASQEVAQDQKGKKGGTMGKGRGKGFPGMKGKGKGFPPGMKGKGKGFPPGMKGKGKGKGGFPFPPGMKKGKKKADSVEVMFSDPDRQVAVGARLETPIADWRPGWYHVQQS